MNCTNNILKAAVAAAFGVVAGQAGAAVDYSVSPATGITKFAKEISTDTVAVGNTAGALDIKLSVPAAYSISSTAPLYVKIKLTSGSVFKGTPVLTCSANSGGATAATGAVTVGGAGDSAVTFNVGATKVASGDALSTSGFCTVSAHTGIGIVTGTTSRDVNFSATVEYKNGLSDVVSGSSGSYITFVKGLTARFSAGGTITVDATSGSDNFSADGNVLSQTLASAGTVTFTAVGTSAATTAGAADITVGDVIGASSGSVTVNGAALAAALAANGTSGVFLDANGACNNVDYKVASTGTNSVTFTGITTAHIQAGVTVCLNVSGATSTITTGQLTASVVGTALSNVTADFGSAGNLSNVASSGTTRNAYFVNASTSTNKTSVIRIVNTGTVSGTIRASAYKIAASTTATGTAVGTANVTIATLAVGESVTLTSADLESLLGYTPGSTEKYRVQFGGGLTAFEVLNFTRDVATGNLALSQSQTN